MATQMIDGFAEMQLVHPIGGLIAGGFSSFELTGSSTASEAKRYNTAGKLIVSDSRSETTYALKLGNEVFSTRYLELGMGERAKVSTTAKRRKLIEAIVPISAPYEIPLPGVTTAIGNAASVHVTLQGNGPWNFTSGNYKKLDLEVITTGTVATGQAKVDLTTPGSEKLALFSGQAGAAVLISYEEPVANKLTIGLEPNPELLKNFYFSAQFVTDEAPNGIVLICPQISKTSGFGVKTEDVSKNEHDFTVSTAPGFLNPFYLIHL